MNMNFYRKLPIPKEVKELYPLTDIMTAQKLANDKAIADIFKGASNKLLLVIGPCSADNSDAVLKYVEKLKAVSEKVADKIFIVPRVYTSKPRTLANSYKGMLHQPDPNKHPDIFKGIVETRRLHMTVLKDYGFSTADEMLYPDNLRYLSDLLSYTVVGARSVENQQHRLTASGLDIPVGFKNPISGDLNTLVNSVVTAFNPHTFIYRGWEVESLGNPLSHAILRGFVDSDGNTVSNFSCENIEKYNYLFAQSGFSAPAVIIDTNHANSGKDPLKQIDIAKDCVKSLKSNDFKSSVKGLMIESYLVDGAQNPGGEVFGQSITDPCLGFEKTEKLIFEIADIL